MRDSRHAVAKLFIARMSKVKKFAQSTPKSVGFYHQAGGNRLISKVTTPLFNILHTEVSLLFINPQYVQQQ